MAKPDDDTRLQRLLQRSLGPSRLQAMVILVALITAIVYASWGAPVPVLLFFAFLLIAWGSSKAVRAAGWDRMAPETAAQAAREGRVTDLLDAIESGAPPLRRAASKALVTAVPRLTDEEAAKLRQSDLATLRRLLRDSRDARFDVDYERRCLLPVLALLGRVGDAAALADVEAFAAGPGLAAIEPELKAAAEQSAVQIRQRLAQAGMRNSLLRPTNAPSEIGANLVRPVTSDTIAEPNRLLRAAEGDDQVTR